ncbi:hypothetical protein NDU88_001122 [Pleurodeles waltl]|uniref:Uncharacterized protein n=1 Tax=Pleurodeles waltl TaxID=8319 RepID=A0AAV7P303_PLEWA|nr:hypothetical protein NDU88_001122 [Pleurodeles waltl]
MLPVGAPRLACFAQTSLVLPLPLFPQRGIRVAPLRVRRNSSASRDHNAAFHLSSGFNNCGAHIRSSPAEPSPHFPQEPEAILARCFYGAARHVLRYNLEDCSLKSFL